MSKHEVKVVAIPAVEKHPGADSLGIVTIDGYTVVVKLDQWKEGDLAVYVEPDYIVPTEHPAFAFLGRHGRIRVKKLRGIYSQGLLVPLTEFPGLEIAETSEKGDTGERPAREGDDVMVVLGIVRYEPEVHAGKSYVGAAREAYVPPGLVADIPKYDLENLRKNLGVFVPGERVIVTEKIHGCNARYTFRDGKMWLGSRTRWVEDDGENVWSKALRACPWIEDNCRSVPGAVLFGEVFGRVQDLDYGLRDQVSFRAFDVKLPQGYADADIITMSLSEEHGVPVLYDGPFDFERMLELAEGPSTLPGAKHVREGIVIKPAVERQDPRCGRVALKLVGNGYYDRKGG